MASTTQAAGLAAALGERLRGTAIGPDDSGFDEARSVHNGMIDKHPALIARCVDAGDVSQAVGFARDEGLDVAIRCGAHNAAGFSSVDDGLVIDLTPIRYAQVDADARIARVGGGSTFGDVDHATHAFGLATPSGTVSTTGVGGLTLGGGIGYLTRAHGLSIDNLIGADVVLADGSIVRADEKNEPDLYWALRGGGGNFGVVTEFRFQLHPVDDRVRRADALGARGHGDSRAPLSRVAAFPARRRLCLLRDADRAAGRPVPGGAAVAQGVRVDLVQHVLGGAVDGCARHFRAAAKPALDGVAEVPFPGLQSAFDPLIPFGTHIYWRAHFIEDMQDGAIPEYVRFAESAPTWVSQTHVYPLNGAAARIGNADTAWGWRDAGYAQVFVAIDHEAGNDEALREWAVDYSDAIKPYAMEGAYTNFIMDEGQDRARACYRDNYGRLQQIKAKYDPGNLFHVNQNIQPAT